VRYTCDDEYARPEGWSDVKKVIEEVPAHVFDLPFTAARAEELPAGTHRTLEGMGALAITGGVQFGYTLDQIAALKDKANVGVYAKATVKGGLRGDLALEIERQQDKLVRLRWSKGSKKEFDAGI